MTGVLVFQKRPERVQAMQWDNTPESAKQVAAWTDPEGWTFQLSRPAPFGGYVFELIDPDGQPTDVYPNGWIVRVGTGMFQVLRELEFRAGYERVIV
ncbi:hypothetical protein [Rhodococcus sp. B10]|uniref:hypothetical protein n=1 Tax=Rhodococcus sp. B10 TaxID=2695876 RepID=UPI0014300C71|nr:hypothetical protein [Rhodococcus sp. B10]NIL77647.1 hypothetical protein [Rhodococcus sp. B10]